MQGCSFFLRHTVYRLILHFLDFFLVTCVNWTVSQLDTCANWTVSQLVWQIFYCLHCFCCFALFMLLSGYYFAHWAISVSDWISGCGNGACGQVDSGVVYCHKLSSTTPTHTGTRENQSFTESSYLIVCCITIITKAQHCVCVCVFQQTWKNSEADRQQPCQRGEAG